MPLSYHLRCIQFPEEVLWFCGLVFHSWTHLLRQVFFCGVNEAWVLVCCFGWLVNCCVLLCFLVVVVGLFWFVWCILGGVLFCCLLGFVAELWAAVPRSQIMASYHALSHLSSSYLAQEFLYRFCSYLINSIALNAETLKNGSEQGLLAETSSTLKAWHC